MAWQGILGIIVLLGLAWAFSEKRAGRTRRNRAARIRSAYPVLREGYRFDPRAKAFPDRRARA